MRRFHGDLLMGGVAIREIDGELDDRPAGDRCPPAGNFEVEAPQQSMMELGRPYLLLTDDGDSVELVVTDIGATLDPGRVRVQFQATSSEPA